ITVHERALPNRRRVFSFGTRLIRGAKRLSYRRRGCRQGRFGPHRRSTSPLGRQTRRDSQVVSIRWNLAGNLEWTMARRRGPDRKVTLSNPPGAHRLVPRFMRWVFPRGPQLLRSLTLPMKIVAINDYVLQSALEQPFAFSQGWVTKRSATLVEVITD